MRQIPQIHELLRCLAQGAGTIRLDRWDAFATHWVIKAGLAPLLLAYGGGKSAVANNTALQSVLAGTLTAQYETGTLMDAMQEILSAAGERSMEITLLKGISVCSDLYAQPYHRVMGDIDLLVEPTVQPWLENLLSGLGYTQRSPLDSGFYATHSHSMPFHHPREPVVVEVHTALFPPHMAIARTPLFQREAGLRLTMPGRLQGFAIKRLRPEVQLGYITSHMAERLTFSRDACAFFDIALLLRKYVNDFDWDRFLDLLGDGIAVNQVYVALSYLHRHGLVVVPESVLTRLRSGPYAINPLNLYLLHRIIERYLLAPAEFSGLVTDWTVRLSWETLLQRRSPWHNLLLVPWNAVFIPGHPQRFSPAFHWWRLRNWMGNLR